MLTTTHTINAPNDGCKRLHAYKTSRKTVFKIGYLIRPKNNSNRLNVNIFTECFITVDAYKPKNTDSQSLKLILLLNNKLI